MSLSTQAVTDEAVERSYAAADEQWREDADRIIRKLAKKYAEFTTDAIWEAGLPKTREPRAIGGAMRRAARDGVIKKTDRVWQSGDPVCHSRPQTVWKSLV